MGYVLQRSIATTANCTSVPKRTKRRSEILGQERHSGKTAKSKVRQSANFTLWQKRKKTKKLGSVEQDSTMGPNFAICSFCPSWNLVGECLPQTLLCSAKRKRYGLRRFSFFAKTKEEPNVQNLQYPQTQSHCQDPFGR